jgi:uncharacterized protein YecT (DUF1311 family)
VASRQRLGQDKPEKGVSPMFRPVLFLACLATPAAAQDAICSDPPDQMTMTQCAHQEWQIADAELNSVYKRVTAMLKEQDAQLDAVLRGGPEALRDAQRAWITFRDKTCEAEGFAMRGGSAEPMVVAFCLTRITRERIAHLYGMLQTY